MCLFIWEDLLLLIYQGGEGYQSELLFHIETKMEIQEFTHTQKEDDANSNNNEKEDDSVAKDLSACIRNLRAIPIKRCLTLQFEDVERKTLDTKRKIEVNIGYNWGYYPSQQISMTCYRWKHVIFIIETLRDALPDCIMFLDLLHLRDAILSMCMWREDYDICGDDDDSRCIFNISFEDEHLIKLHLFSPCLTKPLLRIRFSPLLKNGLTWLGMLTSIEPYSIRIDCGDGYHMDHHSLTSLIEIFREQPDWPIEIILSFRGSRVPPHIEMLYRAFKHVKSIKIFEQKQLCGYIPRELEYFSRMETFEFVTDCHTAIVPGNLYRLPWATHGTLDIFQGGLPGGDVHTLNQVLLNQHRTPFPSLKEIAGRLVLNWIGN